MRRAVIGSALVAALLSSLLPSLPAHAAVAARCHLRVFSEDAQLRLAFRLSDGGSREDWRVRLFRDGTRVYQRVLTTDREGSFRVVKTVNDPAGPDTILATATQIDTGAVCRVQLRV